MKPKYPLIVFIGVVLFISPLQAAERLVFSTFPSAGAGLVFEEVLVEAYRRIGIAVDFERLPAERALQMADAGEFDGEAARLAIVKNIAKNLRMIPVAVSTSRVVAFSRTVDFEVTGWDSLKHYSVGILTGYKFVESKLKGTDYVSRSSYDQLIKMLVAGRIDVTLLSLLDGLKAINDQGVKGIRVLNPPLFEQPMYHFLHKKHENLTDRITMSLKDMEKEGLTRKILDRVEDGLRGGTN
ncbi:MAG: transporter substrate-binding domain-containing protein [Alphaproteobacteria bacterium]|nr:transporter substrate-binding domain-containing protein [Alphaproteobacteria bacterium]